MHEHEVVITRENFIELLLASRVLTKNHEQAFLEQCTRQGLNLNALRDKMLNMDKLFRVEVPQE
jgi:hypothetical protein